MPEYVIAYWKDIPSSVEVGQGDGIVRIRLSSRFQRLIDTVAMQQGLTSSEAYLAHWEKRFEGTRTGEPREVARDIVSELEAQFDDIRLRHRKTEHVIVYWKDIPSVVEAGKGDEAVRVPLSGRFQKLIDAVAMQQGITSTDDYLNHWEKRSGGIRAGEPLEVAEEVAGELENQFDRIRARYG